MNARPLLYRSIARFVTRRRPSPCAAALVVASVFVVLATVTRVSAQRDERSEPVALLRSLGFSTDDVRALERGGVISRGLEPTSSGEIAVAGAVLVHVPRSYFVDQLRDIVAFKHDAAVLEIGVFGNPPTLGELDSLTISSDDLRSLERCRPKDCAVKLPEPAIDMFARDIDWRAPDASDRAVRAFKRMLLTRTRALLTGGTDAIEPYADGHSQPFSEQVHSLVEASSNLFWYVPEFQQSLTAPRDSVSPGIETVTYWSKERAAFKPIISLTSMSFYTTQAAGTTITFGSSMNFYSSHYLDASLGATVAVERSGSAGEAVYVIYVNRSRVDALHGLFSGLRRWGVQREARGGLRDRLEETRTRLETSFAP
jgi:hypothetical protein